MSKMLNLGQGGIRSAPLAGAWTPRSSGAPDVRCCCALCRSDNAIFDLARLPNQTRPPLDCLHNVGCTDMPEAWKVCASRLGLNGFFVESGLDSAANPKEPRKVETENLITI